MTQGKPSRDVAIAFLLAGLFLMILALISLNGGEETAEQEHPQASVDVLKLVNRHLREIYDRQEMDRKNAEVLNQLTAPPISKVKPDVPTHHFDDLPVFFDQDSADTAVGEELGTYAYQALKSRPLNQQIQHEILEDIRRSQEEEEYRKALAQSLINKAKSQGYELEVDENYKIKSVRKIRIQNAPSIFDPGAVPAQ